MEAQWITALQQRIDKNRVQTGTADRHSYSYDGSFGEFLPEAVVQVRSTEEVVAVLETANSYRVPVTPRGTGNVSERRAASGKGRHCA